MTINLHKMFTRVVAEKILIQNILPVVAKEIA